MPSPPFAEPNPYRTFDGNQREQLVKVLINALKFNTNKFYEAFDENWWKEAAENDTTPPLTTKWKRTQKAGERSDDPLRDNGWWQQLNNFLVVMRVGDELSVDDAISCQRMKWLPHYES